MSVDLKNLVNRYDDEQWLLKHFIYAFKDVQKPERDQNLFGGRFKHMSGFAASPNTFQTLLKHQWIQGKGQRFDKQR